MLAELGYLVGGMMPGRVLRKNKKAQRLSALATKASIYVLLFILGARLGGDEVLFRSIGELGLTAVWVSLCCTLGSVFCVLPVQCWFNRSEAMQNDTPSEGEKTEKSATSFLKGFIGSLYILGCFVTGLTLARLGLLPAWMFEADASVYVLWVMLFCVGMGIGFDLGSLLIVREMGLQVVLVPLLAIIGTGLGSLAAALLMPGLGVNESLVVASGFGYYSISSVIISNHGLVVLGSIALIANIFRELFVLLFTPLLMRLFGPLSPIAAAGAPAMDTCLPMIMHFTGERYGIVSIFTGLVLTMLVPFMVPLVLLLF